MKKIVSAVFDSADSPEIRLQLLNRSESRRRNWAISEKEFALILTALRLEPPAADPEKGLIYTSSGKYVWRLEFNSSAGKKFVAYKTNPGKTPWRYIFNSSLPIREVRNYWRFEALGIPVAKVIAAGDVRKNFVLQETFIVTEFIENSRDGRVFMPGGDCRNESEKRHLFCQKNLELLAKLHCEMIFHKAFHPRNLLWRENAGNMEIFWIDVARCRKVKASMMKRAVIVDLHTFFRDMRLTPEETLELIQYYTTVAPQEFLPGSAGDILKALINFRRRRFSKRTYNLFTTKTLPA